MPVKRLAILKSLLKTGLQCAFCGREIPSGDACPKCGEELATLLPEHEGPPYCAYRYDGILRSLIRSIKYDDCRYKTVYAARLMYQAWQNIDEDAEIGLVTYVPVHQKRRRTRGFDQSEILSAELAKLMGVPHARLFERIKNTKAQYSLGATQRAENLAGAFALINEPPTEVKAVMVVDDIYTTGATMRGCICLLPPSVKAVPFSLCYDQLV